MKRLMVIQNDEFIKYQQGRPCFINAILPIVERLDYMKIIVKTYIDMKQWNYSVIIGDDVTTNVVSDLDARWFRDCEDYIKRYSTITNLKIRS